MPAILKINIQQFIDARRIAPFQLKVLALCFLVVAIATSNLTNAEAG